MSFSGIFCMGVPLIFKMDRYRPSCLGKKFKKSFTKIVTAILSNTPRKNREICEILFPSYLCDTDLPSIRRIFSLIEWIIALQRRMECKYIMMKIMTHAEYTQKCSRNGIEKPKIWWRWTLSTAPLVYLVVTSISKLSLWLLDITTTACWKQQRVGQGVVGEVERRRRQRECSPTLLTFGPARHSFLAAKRRRFSRKSRHFLRTAVLQNKPSQVVLVQTLPE